MRKAAFFLFSVLGARCSAPAGNLREMLFLGPKIAVQEKNQRGFTLLEVMIAFALLAGILLVAIIAQSSSLASSSRSKNILMVTTLARNFINEQELKYEGMKFEQLPTGEQKGEFPEPNQGFKWTLKFEEVDFAVMSEILSKQAEAAGQEPEANQDQVIKMFEEYLKKSVRKMTLTVEYPDSGATSKLTFTELLVNYDADFIGGI